MSNPRLSGDTRNPRLKQEGGVPFKGSTWSKNKN